MNIKSVEKNILGEIKAGNLALFAGAGLSMGSGYVSWKELLRDIAEEINLEIDIEDDLLAVAQYHVNRHKRNRLNEKIVNEFSDQANNNPMMNVLCRLPIDTIWTTNYDKLIEKTLDTFNKIVDVKISNDSLTINRKNKDVTLFKIHGDKDNPNEAIITRDDYENFFRNKSLYINRLVSDLISKTFIFVGYSFGDPNFEHVLSRIRYELGENTRKHYCFQKKIIVDNYETQKKFEYDKIKHELRIEDLKKYNIETILVDNFSDITEFFRGIEFELYKRNIFVSGAAQEYSEFGTEDEAKSFITGLIYELGSSKNKIISGYGLGFGGFLVDGLVKAIFDFSLDIDEYYLIRPFPQNIDTADNKKEIWDNHRRRLISQSTISLFMFGNKLSQEGNILSNGMYREFELSKENGNIIIPIASTGYMAKKILDECIGNDEFWYLKDSYSILSKSKEIKKINKEIKIIIERYKEGR